MSENNTAFENRNCMQAQFLFDDRAPAAGPARVLGSWTSTSLQGVPQCFCVSWIAGCFSWQTFNLLETNHTKQQLIIET